MFKRKDKSMDKAPAERYTKETFGVQIVMTIAALFFIAPIFIILNYENICVWVCACRCHCRWRPEADVRSTWLESQVVVNHHVGAGNSAPLQ